MLIVANTATDVISGTALGLAAATVGWIQFSFRRAMRFRRGTLELVSASAETTLQLSPPAQEAQARREPVIVLDYVDRDLLEDIARQKNVQVGDVTLSTGTAVSDSESISSELSGQIGVPGAGVGGRLTSNETRELARSRIRAVDVSYNARAVLRELMDALDADSELRRDLALVPEETETEAFIVGALTVCHFDWGLDGLGENDPRKSLEQALDAVLDEASDRIAAAKARDLRAAAPDRGEVMFALAETEWSTSQENDGLVLRNTWLVETSPNGTVTEGALVPGLLKVPIDPTKLVGMGRQRIKLGSERWFCVFGQIDVFDAESLMILPIAVWAP